MMTGRSTTAALAAALVACLAAGAAEARTLMPESGVKDLVAEEILSGWGERLDENGELAIRLARLPVGEVDSIRRFAFDPVTGRFAAVVLAGDSLQRISGTARSEIEVPVPQRRIMRGEMIVADDLSLVRMPANQARSAVVDMADLVGKEARRVLSEGRPVTETSVGEPLVVERNRPVSLVYTVGDLRITAKGRALADGSVGEAIRAVNEESHRTITGIVLAEGTVGVTP